MFSLPRIDFGAKEREFWARHAKALAAIPPGTQPNYGYYFLSTECCYATALRDLQEIGRDSRVNWRERWCGLQRAEYEIASAPTADGVLNKTRPLPQYSAHNYCFSRHVKKIMN